MFIIMDQSLGAFTGSINGHRENDELAFVLSGEDLRARLKIDDALQSRNPNLAMFTSPNSGVSCERESVVHQDCDFSDVVFQYISQMLMEEDIGEKTCMRHESSALEATEKSLYEAIGETYPPRDYRPIPHISSGSISESPNKSCVFSSRSDSSGLGSSVSSNPDWKSNIELHERFVPAIASPSVESSARSFEVFDKNGSAGRIKDGFTALARTFPSNNASVDVSRGKRNPYSEQTSLEKEQEGRTNKQSAVYVEPEVTSEMLDMVLLNGAKGESALRQAWQNGQMKGSDGSNSRGRGKKKGRKREVIDLRTLLTFCAQAVAVDDKTSASELLKKIRQHASLTGDGMQRVAYYMADGLEARLAGSGTQIHRALMYKPTSAVDTLKAYQLFQTACPFKKLSNFFSNRTIMNVAERASKLHIIEFGIGYGFQWPCLIQSLSTRPGGPPSLRITGIDLPQPGFRPAEKIEGTGNHLKNYAEKFKVPFQFKAVAQKWEAICVKDLGLEEDEVLVVNCMYRLKNLLDETVVVESPRDRVLSLIKQMNPDVFIQGVVNAAHSAPLFILRFREALFHFSTQFDMLDMNVPRNVPERGLIEREIFGRQAMNVVACEGPERVDRPETYKQWQLRNLRAGFRLLPLDSEIVRKAKDRVKAHYHKDFVIEEDSNWLLQGWKGRLIYALSTWKPEN
ncbi:scarecrow-like protein 9 [Punica granatum]|nr:scarecrow-like protein 9 [Punica granatum]